MHLSCLACGLAAACLCLGCGGGRPAPRSRGAHARGLHGRKLLVSTTPVPTWWTGRAEQIRRYLTSRVRRGELRTLATSPGGRAVHAVCYGKAEPRLKGPANWNSALGARKPDAYYRRGERKRPVLVILAGAHGQEMEGMVAALSAVSVMETGKDLAGGPQPTLRRKLSRLRLIVIPLANPDGRARCPYDGWVALPTKEMTRWGQGTRRDGSLYGWPGCKAVHPMAGDVGILGAYFDDAGVNLMHDEWHAPMSAVTAAVLKLASEEGPDLLANLHGHQSPPMVLETAYAPRGVKEQIRAFAKAYYAALDSAGIAHGRLPRVGPDGPAGTVPPSFNLTSMFYHAGTALPMTFESPQGLADARQTWDYPTILRLHHLLFESAADWLTRTAKETK